MVVFAHRGVSGYYVDNSLKAFEKAVEWSCPIELDVQMSKDGTLYVFHDYYIKPLKKDLVESRVDEIECVRIDNERIPTFEEVLKMIPDHILINVEIKQRGWDQRDIVTSVYNMILRHHRSENIIVSSFNHQVLYNLRQVDKTLKIGMLFDQVIKDFTGYIDVSGIVPTSVHLGLEVVSVKLVDELHKLGYPIYVYTVNQRDIFNRLNLMGVDGIFTNYPDKIGGHTWQE